MAQTNLPDPKPLMRRSRGGAERAKVSLELATVTPILGGAPVTRKVDSVDVIRVPSIRGQLRFWWRALYGHEYKTPEELAKAEGAIWGYAGAEGGGRSSVDIHISNVVRSAIDEDEILFSDPASYALWPARGNPKKQVAAAPRFKPGLRFRLEALVAKEREAEIRHALTAWILFGGYGSRARRGCGSLLVGNAREDWLPNAITRDEWTRLFGSASLLLPRDDRTRRDMPSLFGARLLFGAPQKNAMAAWITALQWLRDFRQGAGLAREPGEPNRPGRSRWPEPDKIRRLSGPGPWAHEPRPEHGRMAAWPRGSFGLPILGRFQQKMRGSERYYDPPDPTDFELGWCDEKGTRHDRLASPLILKPLPLAKEGFVPIALWLFRKYPDKGQVGLVRKRGGEKEIVADSKAPFDRLVAPGDKPLFTPLEGKKTLQNAFLDWLKDAKNLKELG